MLVLGSTLIICNFFWIGSSNYIINGDFETPLAPTGWRLNNLNSITGWTGLRFDLSSSTYSENLGSAQGQEIDLAATNNGYI